MRILIAANSYPTKKNPRHQVFIKNICDEFRERGHNVDVIYNPYFSYFKSEINTGTRFTSALKTLFLFIKYLPYILIKARKYDVFFSHGVLWPGYLMSIAQRWHNTPHVCYDHGQANLYSRKRSGIYRLAKKTFKSSTLTVSNSLYMAKRLRDDYDAESIVIYPGYRSDLFSYYDGIRNRNLVFAGSATHQKGIDLILEAVRLHSEYYRSNALQIQIYCSGGKKKEYLEFVETHMIRDIIRFGSKLLQPELAELFRDSKIVIMPSREEAHGLVAVEAIACGAYVVASDNGGFKEYIKDEFNGMLFKNDDYRDLQLKIERALNKFEEFAQKQPVPSQSVQSLSLDETLTQIEDLFQTLLRSEEQN